LTSTNTGPEIGPALASAAEIATSAARKSDIGGWEPSDHLGARKAAQGAANERAVLLALAKGRLSPSELQERCALPEKTRRDATSRLESRGLVARDGRKWICLTAAGEAEAGAELPGLAMSELLDRALRQIPAEGLRAFVRLMLSNVIARHHLGDHVTDGWGCHVAVGPTKTCKTAMGEIVAEVFAIDKVDAIRTASAETPGSLFARHEMTAAGRTYEPSPVLAQPFVCVDELDKAPADLRRAFMLLAQGRTRQKGEGTKQLEVRPVVLFCANGAPSVIRHEYRRRAVVLDTSPLRAQLRGAYTAMRSVFGALPRLHLDAMRPPAAELPGDLRAEVLGALAEGLTEAGYDQLDERAIELMALGRVPLVGGDVRVAVFATAADYLTCARTVDEARSGIPWAISEALGADPAVLGPDLVAAVDEATRRQRVEAKSAEESLTHVRARAELAETLRQAVTLLDLRKLPVSHRVQAQGVRAVLCRLLEQTRQKRTDESLSLVRDQTMAPLREARELLENVAAERRQAEQHEWQRKQQLVANRYQRTAQAQAERTDRDRRRQIKAEVAKELVDLVAECRKLEGLYRRTKTASGERADKVLASYRLPGSPRHLVAWYEAPPPPPPPTGAGAFRRFGHTLLTGAAGGGWWVSPWDETVTFPAAREKCEALRSWGPDTRRVIAPLLRALHEREDELRAAAGRMPRASRPSLR
jgi:hypothetical protein